jgi:hypothetical protein
MFVFKAKIKAGAPERCFTQIVYGLARKH